MSLRVLAAFAWPAIPIGASDFRQRISWLREAILGNDGRDLR
jgi:hypothetical protein